jgi:hypothetical protein
MGRCRSILLVLVGFYALISGCTAYRPVEFVQVSVYDHVRVTMPELDKMLLFDPSLAEDRLRGYLSEHDRSVGNEWGAPVDKVTEIKAKQAAQESLVFTTFTLGACLRISGYGPTAFGALARSDEFWGARLLVHATTPPGSLFQLPGQLR